MQQHCFLTHKARLVKLAGAASSLQLQLPNLPALCWMAHENLHLRHAVNLLNQAQPQVRLPELFPSAHGKRKRSLVEISCLVVLRVSGRGDIESRADYLLAT